MNDKIKFIANLSRVLGHSMVYEQKNKYPYAENIFNAATFTFYTDNGAAVGNPASGTTRTVVTDFNWKNIDDASTAYSASPITAGNNSFEKFLFGGFSGSFNQVLGGLWQHTGGNLGAGLVVKCVVSGTGQGSYTTPSATTNANLTRDLTQTGLVSTGLTVLFGASGHAESGKNASTTSNPAFSQYLITQLQTTVAASAGDTVQNFFVLNYSEN